ncbi:MAG: Hsp20/alpha crystallin family protein [Syntrophobacteraceae bacterium]|nr:Hsp20/alpha crystallin family protein [Syntrophobacteraceae bacterium]
MAAETGRKDFLGELKAMKERMEDIFTRSFDPGADRQDRTRREDDWVPLSDIVDSGKELVYSLDLPGVMEHDIEVECKDDRLWISGLRKGDLPEGESIRIERPKGSFSRVFKFPCPVDEEAIQAEFKKGVLRISVPKSSPGCRARRIEVREVE